MGGRPHSPAVLIVCDRYLRVCSDEQSLPPGARLAPDLLVDRPDNEIMDRWCALFKGPLLIQRYREGDVLSTAESATVSDIVNVWRNKFSSIR